MSRTDKAIDLLLQDIHIDTIAAKVGKDPNLVEGLRVYCLQSKKFCTSYEPKKRNVRTGLPIGKREKEIILEHKRRNIPTELTAKILQRPLREFYQDTEGADKVRRMKAVATSCDVLWAHMYLKHCNKTPVISDAAYDLAKKEEIEFGGGQQFLSQPASERVVDYPPIFARWRCTCILSIKRARASLMSAPCRMGG